MNIFNKTFFTIALALAIPLSMQANWFSSLANLCPDKNTMAAGAYKLFKFVDKIDLQIQPLVFAIIKENKALTILSRLPLLHQAHRDQTNKRNIW